MVLLLQRLKQLLVSPYGMAALASLSFHGVLFAAVPRFSSASFAAFSDENGTAEARTVPLVTLSAEEQGRLPNFNRPQLPSVPELPSTNRNSTLLRNLPSASTLNPRSNIFNRYSSSNRTTSPSIITGSRFNNPYNLPITNPPERSEDGKNRRDVAIVIPPPPTESTLETELEIENRQAEEAARADDSTPEQTEEVAEGLPDLPEDSNEVLAPEDSEIAANAEAEPTKLERLQAKFQFDATNTTDEEALANYEQWITPSEEADDVAIAMAEPGELQIESGSNLCVENPPTDGLVGVLVDPDGTPSDAVVLRSTGYDYLNQAVLETIVGNDFPETDTPVRYPFDVVVNYDAETCQSSEAILNTAQDTEQSAVQETEQNSEE